MEIKAGDIINLGTGIPNDVVGKICNEEGVADDIMITVESGIYGGVQASGIDFGIGKNLYAMITHHEKFNLCIEGLKNENFMEDITELLT